MVSVVGVARMASMAHEAHMAHMSDMAHMANMAGMAWKLVFALMAKEKKLSEIRANGFIFVVGTRVKRCLCKRAFQRAEAPS